MTKIAKYENFGKQLYINNSLYTNYENVFIELDS